MTGDDQVTRTVVVHVEPNWSSEAEQGSVQGPEADLEACTEVKQEFRCCACMQVSCCIISAILSAMCFISLFVLMIVNRSSNINIMTPELAFGLLIPGGCFLTICASIYKCLRYGDM